MKGLPWQILVGNLPYQVSRRGCEIGLLLGASGGEYIYLYIVLQNKIYCLDHTIRSLSYAHNSRLHILSFAC